MKQNFPRICRIRKTWEFQQVRKMGCKLHTPHFILYRMENSSTGSRLGLTVSKKVGNAVQRNRIKRLIREFFRTHGYLIENPCDISIIAKRGAALLATRQIFAELGKVLR